MFENLSAISERSLYDIDQLKNQFADIFNTPVTNTIVATNPALLKDEVIGANTLKILRIKYNLNTNESQRETSAVIHFKKTNRGWKLFNVFVLE